MPLIACPECNREISDKAVACPQCGFPVRARSPAQVGPQTRLISTEARSVNRPTSPLQEIAYRQKLLLYAVLINILSQYPMWYLNQTPSLSGLAMVVLIANAVFGTWCFYKLGRALDCNLATIVLFSLGLFIPCVCIGVMYVFSARATLALKNAGIRVGLLGAKLSTVP